MREDFYFTPLYISDIEQFEKKINLLLITEENKNVTINSHYVWIKNFESALKTQIPSHHNSAKFICERCLQCSSSENAFINHKRLCANVKAVLPIMPYGAHAILKFNSYNYLLKIPFIIYRVRWGYFGFFEVIF